MFYFLIKNLTPKTDDQSKEWSDIIIKRTTDGIIQLSNSGLDTERQRQKVVLLDLSIVMGF